MIAFAGDNADGYNYSVSLITAAGTVTCPSCTSSFKIPRKELSAVAGAFLSSRRKTRAGTPKKLAPCKYCGEMYGCNDLRAHWPKCKKKPATVQPGRPSAEAKKKKERSLAAKAARARVRLALSQRGSARKKTRR